MAHTTLASTDRALEKIGDFVAVQDSVSLKAIGRTFAWRGTIPLAIFCALAERLAMAGVPSELVEDLENDFPRLMERQRCKICRGLFQGDGYTHAAGAKLCQRCATETMDDSATVFTTP